MLPTLLSEGTLSLVAGKDRQALSYFITIDKDFTVTDRQITRSLICVNHRLTYEQVDTLLCSEAGAESISEEADTMLPILCSISSSLEEIRIQRGAVSFNRREMLPVISDDFSISLEESFDDSPSRKLVGELMILTNETVALFAKNNLIPLIFRGQEPPDENIPEVTEAVPDGPAREYYVRSLMKRSVTSTKPLPHFGLGLLAYAHCTSPIRRVADLINQRQILSFIKNGSPELDESEVVNLSGEIEHGSQEASYIQREGNRYWLLQYLKQEKTSHLWGTIVKTQGKKPLAEIDGIFSLLPFKPQASSSSDDINKRKGERIYMRIVRLEPLRDTIILEETKAPNAG
jgi:exoribonuclease-2